MEVDKLSFRQRLGLEAFRRFRHNEASLHTLKYLFWECTLRCNLVCKHCGSDCRKNVVQKDMPLVDFLKAIDLIVPHVNTHKTMVVLTGGEPLLRQDIEQCGHELYAREFPWGLVSNGMVFSEKRLYSLLNAGLGAVTVSLDGLGQSHNLMRGDERSFKQVVNAIRLLVSVGSELIFDVVTCVSNYNFSELHALKELLISLGVKAWRIFTVFPVGRAASNKELQLPADKFRQVFDFIKETRKEGQIKLSYGCEGFLGSYETEVRNNFFFCRAGISIGSILVDGSVSACPNLRSNFVQGNIYQNDFMEVWDKRYQVFRDRSWTKQGECANCKYFRYCEGNGMHLRNENGDLLFCHLKRLEVVNK